jgi:hypothetical protein
MSAPKARPFLPRFFRGPLGPGVFQPSAHSAAGAAFARGLPEGCAVSTGSVSTAQSFGWEQAGLEPVTSGTEVATYDRFKLLYAKGSLDEPTGLPIEYVVMLCPEYIAGGGGNPGAGVAVVTNTEPTLEVTQGFAYIWGRWPVPTTGRAASIVEQFGGGGSSRTRTILWIDKSVSPEVHRFFFFPNGTGQRLHVTLIGACSGQTTQAYLEQQSYIEVVRVGSCNQFASAPVVANSNGWWNDTAINNYVQHVFNVREAAGLQ